MSTRCHACHGDGTRQCEHGKKYQHTVTSGPDAGRICQPPDCNTCRGHGMIYGTKPR